MKKLTIDFYGKPLSIEVGRVAKQASGSALIQCGETMVLVTAVAAREEKKDIDFLPLSVDYFERFSSGGKIPGGYFKREGRQTEREILISRLCDRPIRPLFPDNYKFETQVICTVLSYDKQNESDVLAVLGASVALTVSDLPFQGPIAAVRVGRVNGKFIANPSITEMETSDIDMLVASSREAIVMVEGGAKEVPEAEMLDALMFAFEAAKPLLAMQDELQKALGKPKRVLKAVTEGPSEMETKVRSMISGDLAEALKIREKLPRYAFLSRTKEKLLEKMIASDATCETKKPQIKEAFEEIVRSEIRNKIVSTKRRVDDRASNEVRSISIEVGVLPRTHGSSLFTRGETQAICTATLGTSDDEQRMDSLNGEWWKGFMLHYNFPPYSVGEVKPMRGPGRREIGHGALAHRAISAVMPTKEEFPYTVRVVSDILESHGSSSMASVCGGVLALMDAGVPIKASVAGIAMGLVKEKNEFLVLSDISGDEDHIGDMDFKVAGTSKGITAIQMDIKVLGISREVLDRALAQAREGRMHILEKMAATLSAPRTALSPYAPRIETVQIHPDKIREIIGPGGKMIRSIVEQSKAKIDVDDSGKITIASPDLAAIEKAKEIINSIIAEPEVGRIYKGKVRRIMEYGAFVEIMPGTDGLVHISQLHAEGRVNAVEDVVREGDEIEVKVISIDHQGKIKLSQREAVAPGSGNLEEAGQDRGPRGAGPGGDRGGRDRGPRRGPGGDSRPRQRD